MLELPVHWSLDDWPHLHWKPGRGDAFTAPEAFLDTWLAEFDSARADRRHVTYTMHPEVIGRGYRAQLLDGLIAAIKNGTTVWFADARGCGTLGHGMTFPVHRSGEPTPQPSAVKRSGARRRRRSQHTLARLPADVRRDATARTRRRGARVD